LLSTVIAAPITSQEETWPTLTVLLSTVIIALGEKKTSYATVSSLLASWASDKSLFTTKYIRRLIYVTVVSITVVLVVNMTNIGHPKPF